MATGKDAVLQLKAKLNQLDTASNRTLRPELALLYLNDAHKKLVRSKYVKTNVQDMSHFQKDQLSTDELNTYTKTESLADDLDSEGNIYFVDLSTVEDYWVHLKSRVKVKVGDKYLWVSPNLKKLDSVNSSSDDPFNSTEAADPIMYFEEGKVKVITDDSFSITDIEFTYLKKMTPITLDNEIVTTFLEDIVDTAKLIILEVWEDRRSQTSMAVDNVVKSS